MKTIPLTQGAFALVDDEDFEYLNQFKWCFDGGYAHRKIRISKKDIKIYMHRFILGVEGQEVDHINGVGLDNRRENLRISTHRQNMQNRKIPSHNTTGYKGVIFKGNEKRKKKYQAHIKINGKEKYLGYYFTPQEAALAYNIAAKEYFSEYANLNKV